MALPALPSDWFSRNASQKLAWFIANGVTADDLTKMGEAPGDIDALVEMGLPTGPGVLSQGTAEQQQAAVQEAQAVSDSVAQQYEEIDNNNRRVEALAAELGLPIFVVAGQVNAGLTDADIRSIYGYSEPVSEDTRSAPRESLTDTASYSLPVVEPTRNLGPGITLANPLTGVTDFGTKTVTEASGDTNVDVTVPQTVVDYLIANNPTIADSLAHSSTFVKTYRNVNGKLEEVDASSITPQDAASGNVIFQIGGKTGGPDRERVAQIYVPRGDKLEPVGEASFYKGEHPDQGLFDAVKMAAVVAGVAYGIPALLEAGTAALGGAAAAETALAAAEAGIAGGANLTGAAALGADAGLGSLASNLTVGEAVGVISNPTSLITNPISKGLSDYVISNLGLTGAEALAAKTAVYATVNGTAAELMGGNFKDAATGTVVAAGLQHLPLPTGDLGLTDKNLTFNQITGRIADSVINNVGSALGIKDLTDTKAGEMLTSGATKAVSGGLTAAAMGANSDQILTNMGIQGLVGALGDVKIPFTKLDDTLATELTTGSFAESIDLGDFNTLGADASVTVGATALGNLDASLAGISNNLPVITQKGTATVTVTAADCAKQGKQYDPANGKCIEPSSGIAQILSGITGGLNAPIVAAPVTVQAKVDNCKALGKTYNPNTDQCEDTITSPVNVISSGITGGLNTPIVAAPVIVKSKADECKALGKVYNPVTQLCDDAVVTPPVVTETITVTACGEGATRVNGVCVCSDPSLVYDSAQKKCVAKTAEPPPKPDTPCGVTGQVRDAAGNCGCPAGQVVLNDPVSGTQYCGTGAETKPDTPTCGADQYLDDYNNCTCVDPKKVIDSTTGLCIDTVAGGDGNDTIPTIPFLPTIPSGNTDPGYSPNLKKPFTASRTYTAPPEDYDYFEDPYFQRFGPITYTPPAGYEGAGKGMAEGGLAGLAMAQGGRTLQPRYLGGITDGMADKVPANIDGRRPAALSDGEFVIPADVVSHLGNGNSSAGAKILYKMMDRIRKARTGTTKQGRQINPDKFLPR